MPIGLQFCAFSQVSCPVPNWPHLCGLLVLLLLEKQVTMIKKFSLKENYIITKVRPSSLSAFTSVSIISKLKTITVRLKNCSRYLAANSTCPYTELQCHTVVHQAAACEKTMLFVSFTAPLKGANTPFYNVAVPMYIFY